ncbi:MAG: hypothetical protein ABSE99_10425 [Terracidiphilus sp.]|jgi:hypothetical protein
MMKMYFDEEAAGGLDDLFRGYGSDEFASSTRSTVPLVSLLMHGGEAWNRIAGEFTEEGCEAHLEYQVKPPKGRGTASHTDVMLIEGRHATAIEAKWTEPRYEEVGDWLRQGNSVTNRRDVMTGWLSLLSKHATRKLDVVAFSRAVYQMVHRAASACAAGNPAMVYLQFSPLPDGNQPDIQRLKDDLIYLHGLLGVPIGLPFFLVEVEAKATARFAQILGLPKGSQSTADAVMNALREGPLFDFTGYHVHRLQGEAERVTRSRDH